MSTAQSLPQTQTPRPALPTLGTPPPCPQVFFLHVSWGAHACPAQRPLKACGTHLCEGGGGHSRLEWARRGGLGAFWGGWCLYWFPWTTSTKDHKLGGLKLLISVAGSQEHVFVTDTVVTTIIPSGNRGWQFAPNPTARQGKEASFKLEFAWFQKPYSHPFGESLVHSE